MSRVISSEQAANWLLQEKDTPSEGFIWLHFNLANTASEKWLARYLQLSEVFYEALHEGVRSTRIEYVDDTLIAVINDVLFDFSFETSDVATLWLSVNERVVISARAARLIVYVQPSKAARTSLHLSICWFIYYATKPMS